MGSIDERASKRISSAKPADIHTLLGPHEDRHLPSWGTRNYSDPTLLAGRSRGSYIHVLALCLAAAADIGAFFQIIELVLARQSAQFVFIVTIGFTATVLYVAHACGLLFRDLRAGADGISKPMPYLCALAWLILGVTAFVIRLRFFHIAQVNVGFSASNVQASGSDFSARYFAGILFFSLYLATGLVAGVGAYLTHNPLLAGYLSADRAFRKASGRLSMTALHADLAEVRCSSYRAELTSAEDALDQEIQARTALAEKLKRATHVMLAQHSKDFTVVDSVFSED